MTVALLFDHFGPYHLARLKGAVAAGIEVTGVEFYSYSRDYAWEPTHTDGLLIKTVSHRKGGSKTEFRSALWKLLTELNPDAVTIPGWAGREALFALEWCLTHKIPAIMMSESSSHDETRASWKEWIKRRLLACCSAALVGGRLHQAYLEELGLKKEQISLGYDTVDNGYFAAGATLNENFSRTPQGVFLASARFIEKKNLSRLIDAYAAYRKMTQSGIETTQETWPLILLGDGELRSTIERQVDALSLGSHISMPGFLQYQDLPAFYKKASTFIHASTTEQWGLVVNEAMASGLPVLVSSRCGCAADLVHDGLNGFTFDPYDTDALAKLMLNITLMPASTREAMGLASEKIIAGWGPDRFGQGLLMASKIAMAKGPRKMGVINHLLIKMLSSR